MTESLSYHQLANAILELTLKSSEAILAVYNAVDEGCEDKSLAKLTVNTKADDSPVTEADLAAHHILAKGLSGLLPNTPILSEEGVIPDYSERAKWQRYWLIDPLDGTKEFIKRNGEFTVNVALIENGCPVLGVITVPVTGISYWGAKGCGAYKVEGEGCPHQPIKSTTLAADKQSHPIRVVSSRQYGNDTMAAIEPLLLKTFKSVEYQGIGSSLKFCLIAEGKADFYPRLALTSEWDTAAAQAIVEAAGGSVLDATLQPMRYNTKESLLNPFFYVMGDKLGDWKSILSQIVIE